MTEISEQHHAATELDAEALMIALVLAPGTYSRNKFFDLFQKEELYKARRRAQLLRSVIKDLTEPWPHPGEIPARPEPAITEEEERDGFFYLSYSVLDLDYRRSVMLTLLEAATLRFALARAGHGDVSDAQRTLVEKQLSRLAPIGP